MQNMKSSEVLLNTPEQSPKHSTWYMIWLKNWNYTHWLVTSTISSLILTELGAVVISAYPSLLSNLWISLGITSSLSIGILSGAAIISLGLVTGWLIYAGHLAFQAFTSVTVDYEPLMKLWTSNHQTYGIILKKLLENDNFLALSRLIKNYPGAQGLHAYLQDPKNVESVRKILQLLDKIWSTDRIDQQLKMVILHLLSQHIQSDEAEAHINNIYSLCEILWQNEELNHELIVKVFQNSSLLKPYLKELQVLSDNPEIFKQCIDEPSLIPYQLANQSLGHKVAVDSLYPYLKQNEDVSLSSLDELGPVAIQIYQIVHGYHGKTPELFIQIWNKLLQHPHLAVIEALIHHLSQSDSGSALLANAKVFDEILNLFNHIENPSLTDSLIAGKLSDIGLFAELIFRLHALSAFSSTLVETIFIEKSQEISLELLKIYQTKIYQADIEHEMLLQDLDKLLIHNQEILDKTSLLSGSSSNYIQDLHKILQGYFQKPSNEEPETVAESSTIVAKKRSISHKILKILHLKPKKTETSTPALETIIEGDDEQSEEKKHNLSRLRSRWYGNIGHSSLFSQSETLSKQSSDESASQVSSNSI